MKKSLSSLALRLVVLAAFSFSARAAVYTVTSLADTNTAGTLRWAIGQANSDPGSTIDFDVAGTVVLGSALPDLSQPVEIDGSTAPGFKGSPVVGVDFAGQPGLSVAAGANGSSIRSLSLVRAAGDGVTILASNVILAGNYIGLTPAGAAQGNAGDGVKIVTPARGNLIGGLDPVTGYRFFDTSNKKAFPVQPVSAWQGLRNFGPSLSQFLLTGTSASNGLLYVGPLAGGGASYLVQFPGAATTSVYGPDNLENGRLRLVGSYTSADKSSVYNHGFVWEGAARDLPGGGKYQSIDYPGAKYQFTHSTMGDLAVGNADGPTKGGLPLGPGVAYIYNVKTGAFVGNVVYPKSKSNTAYGIWHNGGTSYTICGGFSPSVANNLKDQSRPLPEGQAYLVDYDSRTGAFSHWTSFRYQNGTRGRSFITHFEGISSAEKGVYTLNADSVRSDSSAPVQGSWVSVRRNPNGAFSKAQWVDLNYPGATGVTSSNSVYGNHVVGVVIGPDPLAYQATINIGFQLSNVISGNGGNGIGIYGSRRNIVAQNYIGTNPAGTAAVANGRNGILLTAGASRNVIGGQEAGSNNPTGSEGKVTPVFIVPPQGNLISGNRASGVLINKASRNNTLSSNFIGTSGSGNKAIGNRLDGVTIDHAAKNTLLGCTLRQNPFVFYNVISGNRRDGVRLLDANDITVRANFLGIGANNAVLLPNAGNGLTVTGSSRNTQVGGVIPLGNVISGNSRNGIAVLGTASGFISFNTFGGGFAFGGAAPNGRNGILVQSTGGNNLIRTCILSGNLGNGLEISGNASGVQVADTACGTNTDISAPLPNHANGVLIAGTAHHNALGGFEPSVETRTHFSGNLGYGVAIVGQAHDNVIFNSNIGYGFALTDGRQPVIPNRNGGVFLDEGTRATTIGGGGPFFANRINANRGPGLAIWASARNQVVGNEITKNTEVGVYATGACTGSALTNNTITNNGQGPGDDVDISSATGITVTP